MPCSRLKTANLDDLNFLKRETTTYLWLLGINIGMFVNVHVASALDVDLLGALAVPAGWRALLCKPWTLLTYAITHYDIVHLVLNMIWLSAFYVVAKRMCVQRRYLLITCYIAGAIAAGITFVTIGHGLLVGASSSVLAYVAGVAVLARRQSVTLPLFGEARLGIVAAVAIVLIMLGAPSPVSHACGALAGVVVAFMPKITAPFTRAGRLAALEERVRKHGFESLTPTERSQLFYLSRYKK